ncbi:MAG: helix-turn-helix domain-containing protein [Gammaproteobacteria bacterium]|nr:helix-turn-helix domain-containing protein [Gammaproteobacteria bacterium]
MRSASQNKPLTPEKLREIRKSAKLSQSELAHKFGLKNGRTIRRYEAGDFIPPGPVLMLYHMLREGKL